MLWTPARIPQLVTINCTWSPSRLHIHDIWPIYAWSYNRNNQGEMKTNNYWPFREARASWIEGRNYLIAWDRRVRNKEIMNALRSTTKRSEIPFSSHFTVLNRERSKNEIPPLWYFLTSVFLFKLFWGIRKEEAIMTSRISLSFIDILRASSIMRSLNKTLWLLL